MITACINRIVWIILAIIIAKTMPIVGQNQGKNISIGSFAELKKSPEKFSSEERAQIYQNHLSQYLGTNKDSTRLGYEAMVAFGQTIKDDYVTGVGYSTLGAISQMKGDFLTSIEYKKKALSFFGDKPTLTSGIYRSLGTAYITINQLDTAEIYLFKSFESTFAQGDSLEYANAHISLAELYKAQGRYSSAIGEYQNALKYISIAPSRLREVAIHKKIGSIYLQFNDIERSSFYFQKALDIAVESGFNSTANNLLIYIGNNKLVQKKYRLAYDLFSQSYAGIPKDKKSLNAFHVLCLLTQSAIYLDEPDLVELHFKAAKETYSEDFTRFQVLYNETNSKYFIYKKEFDKARHFANLLVSSKKNKYKLKGFNALVDIYQGKEDWKGADVYKDSVLVLTKKSTRLAQQNIIYDYEKKYQKAVQDKEIASLTTTQEIQELRLNRQSRILLFSLIGLLLTGLAAFGFVYAFRIKSKNNALLKDKNDKLAEALSANKMLVKEIHHRVKNNLQVVSSLLNLQSRFEKDSTIIKAINTGKHRVQSMALLHQNLYINEDLKSIHIKKYFEDLADSLVSGYPNHTINLQTEIQDLVMDIDTVVPLGLITNELITNALKYAFDDQDNCIISLSLKEVNNTIVVEIKDNGVGIPFTILPKRPTSMGFQLVQSFANKIKANITIENKNGTSFTLRFDKKPKIISDATS